MALSAGRGGPRFLNFLPDGDLLVGSGQTFGGFEVITPFGDSQRDPITSFFQPELSPDESMTVVHLHDGWDLHVGTSYGRVHRYALDGGRERTKHSASIAAATSSTTSTLAWGGAGVGRGATGVASEPPSPVAEPLEVPPSFGLSPSTQSIDPTLLCSSHLPSSETCIDGWNVFNSYVMGSKPMLSSTNGVRFHPRYPRLPTSTMGPLSNQGPPTRLLSKTLRTKLEESPTGVFPTAGLGLKDLVVPVEPVVEGSDSSSVDGDDGRVREAAPKDIAITRKSFANPNRLLYSAEAFAACYDATANPRKTTEDNLRQENPIEEEENEIPRRYRLMVRPPFYKVANFDYSLYNDSGLWVGWDYAPSFANSFACSVLAMLYFVAEIRTTALNLQLCNNAMSIQGGKHGISKFCPRST